jgi:ABC-2 type transport system permease protein
VTSRIMILLKKDLVLFRRDRFYFLITVIGLIMYVVLYFVMPKTINETLKLGIYAPDLGGAGLVNAARAGEQGINLKTFENQEELNDAITHNKYTAGIVLPENFMTDLNVGKTPIVTLYFNRTTPEEVRTGVTAMVGELASRIAGSQVLLDLNQEVLGKDFSGNQIPWRDRLVPMMIVMILGTEVLSLASLVAIELEQKTIRALLVTPLKIGHLLTAKAVLGTSMAFIQVLLFVAVTGGLSQQPFALILVLMVGSILVTGIGFLVASLARDMMGVTAWGMIVLIIFVIPALGSMMPGILSGWTKVIPSYHLTDAVTQLVNYNTGFGSISGQILVMLGWTAVFGVIGVLALRRRYA